MKLDFVYGSERLNMVEGRMSALLLTVSPRLCPYMYREKRARELANRPDDVEIEISSMRRK